jgi:hypothetical protein
MITSNRYFVGALPNPNITQIYNIIVGGDAGVVTSLDSSLVAVKLPEGDNAAHPILNLFTEYNHNQWITYIKENNDFWNPPN